jgi:regulator of extracellular matrix RemA (YlzA/DUF370 family)
VSRDNIRAAEFKVHIGAPDAIGMLRMIHDAEDTQHVAIKRMIEIATEENMPEDAALFTRAADVYALFVAALDKIIKEYDDETRARDVPGTPE